MSIQLKSIPLPVSQEALIALRKSMRLRTLNDYVDDVHVFLWNDPDYRLSLQGVSDGECVEGSMSADNFLAAGIIRRHAIETGNINLSKQKLAPIVRALGIVLRRYGITRKERAITIDDVALPAPALAIAE